MKLSSYLVKLLAIGLFLLVVILILKNTSLSGYYLPVFAWLPLIFTAITGLEHWIIYSTIKKNPKRFSLAFMGASSAKLLLILLVTVVYLLVDKSQVVPFVVVLFVHYIFFTVFEVLALLKLVKEKS